jgi:dTMP kinase
MGRNGLLICIEGLDKSGKTTQSLLLVDALRSRGLEAVYTTEPSAGEIGSFIKRYVLRRKQRIPASVEALLFAADRVDHVEREIKPMLKEGKIVVSDRYIYSSIAYKEINKMALEPDLAIYIDVPLEVIMRRLKGKERTVMEHPDIQMKVRDIYATLVKEGKLIPVDGNRPIKKVSSQIQRIVLGRLGIE